jgi:GH43 family beta-xylosidase
MYVVEGHGSSPWTSNYTYKSQLETFDQFAIDGTYFKHKTGRTYAQIQDVRQAPDNVLYEPAEQMLVNLLDKLC